MFERNCATRATEQAGSRQLCATDCRAPGRAGALGELGARLVELFVGQPQPSLPEKVLAVEVRAAALSRCRRHHGRRGGCR